jgi:hypothetical protein
LLELSELEDIFVLDHDVVTASDFARSVVALAVERMAELPWNVLACKARDVAHRWLDLIDVIEESDGSDRDEISERTKVAMDATSELGNFLCGY